MALEITRNAQLIVRMPRFASIAEVKKFIWEKRGWIEQKIAEVSVRVNSRSPKKFIAGEEFYYLGEKHPLEITKEQNTKLKFNYKFYLPEKARYKAKSLFINWYKKQAKLNIPKRVRWYANLHKLKFASIKISSAERRFGSCTSRGNLNFTWRLILLPLRIVDYVVVHELAHLVHHNHSQRFWSQVEKMLPDYKERRKWLKKNGEKYAL